MSPPDTSPLLQQWIADIQALTKAQIEQVPEYLTELMAQRECSAAQRFSLANILFHQQEYQLVQQILSRPSRERFEGRWQNLLGLAASRLGDHEQAITAYQRALSENPSLHAVQTNLAQSQTHYAICNGLSRNESMGLLPRGADNRKTTAYFVADIDCTFFRQCVAPLLDNKAAAATPMLFTSTDKSIETDLNLPVVRLNDSEMYDIQHGLSGHEFSTAIYVPTAEDERFNHLFKYPFADQQFVFPSPHYQFGTYGDHTKVLKPDFHCCYVAPTDAPLPQARFQQQHIELGYIGQNQTISDQQIQRWLQALSQHPSLRLHLAVDRFQASYEQAKLYQSARALLVDTTRIRCVPSPQNRQQYWQFLSRLDLTLTSDQHCDAVTILDSLQIGVAVALHRNFHPLFSTPEKLFQDLQLSAWVVDDLSMLRLLSRLSDTPPNSEHNLRQIQLTAHHRLSSVLFTHVPLLKSLAARD